MGKGGSSVGKKLSKEQARQSKVRFNESRPLESALVSEFNTARQGDTPSARFPLVQSDIENTATAGSRAANQVRDNLARSRGIDGTPLGVAIRGASDIATGRGLQIGRTGAQRETFGQLAPFVQGQAGLAAKQGVESSQLAAQAGAQKNANDAAITGSAISGGGAVLGAGIIAIAVAI